MLCVGRAIEFREELFTDWKVLNLGRHTLPCWMAECLGLLRQENSCSESCWGTGVLGSVIVGLDRGQFIDQLFTAVELANFGQMNFSEPVLDF
jgi:hypothetical protein